jgi:hypothetical protein
MSNNGEMIGVPCDFCAEMPREWKYEVDEGYASPWFACGECSRLIETENLKGLVERALEHQLRRPPIFYEASKFFPNTTPSVMRAKTPEEIRQHLYHLYIEFWKHRKGDRIPYDPRRVGGVS